MVTRKVCGMCRDCFLCFFFLFVCCCYCFRGCTGLLWQVVGVLSFWNVVNNNDGGEEMGLGDEGLQSFGVSEISHLQCLLTSISSSFHSFSPHKNPPS